MSENVPVKVPVKKPRAKKTVKSNEEVTKTVDNVQPETVEVISEEPKHVEESVKDPVKEHVEEAEDKKTKRVQSNKLIETYIAVPRVRSYFTLALNSGLESKVKPIKEILVNYAKYEQVLKSSNSDPNAVTVATDYVNAYSSKISELEEQKKALSQAKSRFSGEAPVALSIICDEFVKSLIVYAMDNAKLDTGKKIVQVNHLHYSSVNKIKYYKLLQTLPSYVANENKFKEKQNNNVVENVDDDQEDEVELSRTTFKHYIIHACKDVSNYSPNHVGIKTSTQFKSYLSDLTIELINRLSPLIKLVACTSKHKTITEFAVLDTVKLLLIDGCESEDNITLVQVNEPVKVDENNNDPTKVAAKVWKVEHEVFYNKSNFHELEKIVLKKLELFKKSTSE